MKFLKKIKPFHRDSRGEMFQLMEKKIDVNGILLITCKKGSVRANHYHKKDTHDVYMLKGKMRYTYQDIKTKSKKKNTLVVKKGEIIHTPPMILHAMKFIEDSVFLAITTEKRQRAKYEKDTVRFKLI